MNTGIASVRIPRNQNKASTVGMYVVGSSLAAGIWSKLYSIFLFFLSSLFIFSAFGRLLLADHFSYGDLGVESTLLTALLCALLSVARSGTNLRYVHSLASCPGVGYLPSQPPHRKAGCRMEGTSRTPSAPQVVKKHKQHNQILCSHIPPKRMLRNPTGIPSMRRLCPLPSRAVTNTAIIGPFAFGPQTQSCRSASPLAILSCLDNSFSKSVGH